MNQATVLPFTINADGELLLLLDRAAKDPNKALLVIDSLAYTPATMAEDVGTWARTKGYNNLIIGRLLCENQFHSENNGSIRGYVGLHCKPEILQNEDFRAVPAYDFADQANEGGTLQRAMHRYSGLIQPAQAVAA